MTLSITVGKFIYLLPVLILLGTAGVMLLIEAFGKKISTIAVHGMLAILAVIASFVSLVIFFPYKSVSLLNGALIYDGFTAVIIGIILLLLFITLIVSSSYLALVKVGGTEYFALLLLAASGMAILPMCRELISIIISIEIVSLPLYILSGYNRHMEESKEAGFKYFLLGAFASAFLIYGSALIYGTAGSVWLKEIAVNIPLVENKLLLLLGFGFFLVGFCFKLGIVPFHSWVPDVYEGAPSPVVAFMAGAVKITLLAILIKVLLGGFLQTSVYWKALFYILGILTMFLGNLWALHQMSLKRLLAYSSITHIGFMSTGLVVLGENVIPAILFYAISYAVASLGAFAIISGWARQDKDDVYLDDLRGLSQRQPLTAFLLAASILSLLGLPLTAGFLGKLFLFYAVYKEGALALVIVAVINSIIAVYYYLRVLTAIYLFPSEAESATGADRIVSSETTDGSYQLSHISSAFSFAGITCALLILLLGIAPRIVFTLLNIYTIR